MDDILSQIIAYAPDRIDTETKARALVQGPRNMYAYGQLVQPNADGSRPGYSGEKKLNKTMEKRIANFETKTGEKYKDQPNWRKYDIREDNWTGGGKGEKFKDPAFIKQKSEGSAIQQVRNYLNNSLRENKGKPLSFKTISEIKKAAGVTANIDADITRALQSDKFLNKVNLANFDKLPDEVIKDIKGTFDDVPKDKWNFNKYKFGINKTDIDIKVYDKIRRFVQDPVPSRYGFGFGKPEGWMLVQMDRAYRSGNKNYKPIYAMRNGIKKVVGYVDNTEAGGGKKWFHSDDYIKGKNSDGIKIQGDGKIKAHPDYAENVKYHDIVQKAGKQPNKAILEILKTGGVLDQDGMYTTKTGAKQSLQLRHVMNYVLDSSDYSVARNSIVRHHRGQLKNATSDLQILDRVKNAKVIGIEDRISKNEIKPDDIAKLKKYGVSVRGPDGTLYGSGPKTASGGLKEINKLILKGSTDQELYGKKIIGLKDFKNKDFKQLASYLEKLGCGQAAGGRILFADGVPGLTKCGKKGVTKLENGLKSGFKNADDAVLARGILKSGRFLKDAVSLRGLFGPAALAFTVAAEAGLVGYDMLSTGKSFKEAVGSSLFNYMLGDKTKIDSVEERDKRMVAEGMTPEQMGKIRYFESMMDDMQTGFKNYDVIKDLEKKIEDNTLNQQVDPQLFPDQAFQLETQLAKAQADNQDYFRTNRVGELENYFTPREDGTIPFVEGSDTLQEGLRRNELAQLQSVDNPLQSRRGDEKRSARIRELMLQNPDIRNYMGSYPTNYGFMEGGIASLNVNKK